MDRERGSVFLERDGIKNKSTPRAFLGIHRRGWLLVGGGNMHVASVDGLSETERHLSDGELREEKNGVNIFRILSFSLLHLEVPPRRRHFYGAEERRVIAEMLHRG